MNFGYPNFLGYLPITPNQWREGQLPRSGHFRAGAGLRFRRPDRAAADHRCPPTVADPSATSLGAPAGVPLPPFGLAPAASGAAAGGAAPNCCPAPGATVARRGEEEEQGPPAPSAPRPQGATVARAVPMPAGASRPSSEPAVASVSPRPSLPRPLPASPLHSTARDGCRRHLRPRPRTALQPPAPPCAALLVPRRHRPCPGSPPVCQRAPCRSALLRGRRNFLVLRCWKCSYGLLC